MTSLSGGDDAKVHFRREKGRQDGVLLGRRPLGKDGRPRSHFQEKEVPFKKLKKTPEYTQERGMTPGSPEKV